MTLKHSPAPWTACIYTDAEHRFPHVHMGKERGHCEKLNSTQDRLTINAGGGPMEEHIANALLIGAAPDMAVLLLSWLQWYRGGQKAAWLDGVDGLGVQTRDTLKKAGIVS